MWDDFRLMGGRARAYIRNMKDWGCTASAIFSHSFEIVLSCGITTHALAHQDDSAQPAQFGLGLLITQVARGRLGRFHWSRRCSDPAMVLFLFSFVFFLSIDLCLFNEEI